MWFIVLFYFVIFLFFKISISKLINANELHCIHIRKVRYGLNEFRCLILTT